MSFKVSLADFTPQFPQFIPCNGIGINFSTIAYSANNPAPINNSAFVFSTLVISDTSNWVIVNGAFIADSAYRYLMLGNFFDDEHTDTINRSNGVRCYFFVDDVCVSTDSLICMNYTSISGVKSVDLFVIKNTVDFSQIIIESPVSYSYEIRNMLGAIVATGTSLQAEPNSINIESLSNGMYILTLASQSGFRSFKFLKM